MTLMDHVRTLGRGPGRARSLTEEEAQDAMACMLSMDAAPEAVGALLMLLRMKGETPEEIAGFARAATQSLALPAVVDLDWPSYAAGRTRGQPWFLLSARLVAQAGHRVLIHGWNGANLAVREGLLDAGIGCASDLKDADRLLDRDSIAYLPLEMLSPELLRLLQLREVLGLRSCINTVCRMLNPSGAGASVLGVFHPSYRQLQTDAAARLGWSALSIIKGAGGEFESNPAKDITAYGLRQGRYWQSTRAAIGYETRVPRLQGALTLADLWSGRCSSSLEIDRIIATAALALDTLGESDATARAEALWQNRAARCAA